MSLPYHKVDWDLVAEVRQIQSRVSDLEKNVIELTRLLSLAFARIEEGAGACD